MINNSDSYSNTDYVAPATWPIPLWAMGDYPYYPHSSVPQSTYPGLVSAPGHPSTAGSYIPDFKATDDVAFSLPPTTEMGAFANLPTQVDSTNPNVLDPWFMLALSRFDVKSVAPQPQLVGNPYLTGIDPLATDLEAPTPDLGVSPTSTTPMSQDKWAWPSDFLQSPGTTPVLTPGNGSETGLAAPEHGTNPFEATTSPAGWGASEFHWPIPVASGYVTSNATATYAPTTALGKRRRETVEPQGDGGLMGINVPPQKRARDRTSGILNAKRSAARTRHSLVARTPESMINRKPKEAGRGAERLATPNALGIYCQPSLGPSFQQGWAVDPADGKPTWVEGSVDEEAVHHVDSTVQQQQEEATELFEIPRRLKPGDRLLLDASEADFARGAVQAIKCRLCPDTNLKDFEEFKRHSKTSEMHPRRIRFCNHCGDFFARGDSLIRHNKQPPAECRKVTPVVAAEKRRVTQEAHRAFILRLKHGLLTSEDIERGFSEVIKDRYPESSKKKKKRKGGSK